MTAHTVDLDLPEVVSKKPPARPRWQRVAGSVLVVVLVLAGITGWSYYHVSHNDYAAKLGRLGVDSSKVLPLDALQQTQGGLIQGGGGFLGFQIQGTSGPEIEFALRLPGDGVSIVVLPYSRFNPIVNDKYTQPAIKLHLYNAVPDGSTPQSTVADLIQNGAASIDLFVDSQFYHSELVPLLVGTT